MQMMKPFQNNDLRVDDYTIEVYRKLFFVSSIFFNSSIKRKKLYKCRWFVRKNIHSDILEKIIEILGYQTPICVSEGNCLSNLKFSMFIYNCVEHTISTQLYITKRTPHRSFEKKVSPFQFSLLFLLQSVLINISLHQTPRHDVKVLFM
jgi:hypothetical protein